MVDTFAMVGYNSDTGEWAVTYGEAVFSTHSTKDEAIDAATGIRDVNSVMAFTKGNSNFQTIQA